MPYDFFKNEVDNIVFHIETLLRMTMVGLSFKGNKILINVYSRKRQAIYL